MKSQQVEAIQLSNKQHNELIDRMDSRLDSSLDQTINQLNQLTTHLQTQREQLTRNANDLLTLVNEVNHKNFVELERTVSE